MKDSPLEIRAAVQEDLPGITDIYAWHVKNGTGSFEEEAPSLAEMKTRWLEREANGYRTLVAMQDDQCIGFAYAGAHKARSAYRFTVEDSVYVLPGSTGQGVGFTLLSSLIAHCRKDGYRQMIAVIGDSENHASTALHRRCGFHHIGVAKGLGFKMGRWLDIVFMQRPLSGSEKPSKKLVYHGP